MPNSNRPGYQSCDSSSQAGPLQINANVANINEAATTTEDMDLLQQRQALSAMRNPEDLAIAQRLDSSINRNAIGINDLMQGNYENIESQNLRPH